MLSVFRRLPLCTRGFSPIPFTLAAALLSLAAMSVFDKIAG